MSTEKPRIKFDNGVPCALVPSDGEFRAVALIVGDRTVTLAVDGEIVDEQPMSAVCTHCKGTGREP